MRPRWGDRVAGRLAWPAVAATARCQAATAANRPTTVTPLVVVQPVSRQAPGGWS